MEHILKQQQRLVGAIVKIPLKDGYYIDAKVLEVCLAFYDTRSKVD
jgi:hypothetical protein